MDTEKNAKWRDWYWNRGGRERIQAQRKARYWMTKKEYEELVLS